MTSITFGGGPTIEARRNFSNLKSGSQVPGYGGYIHQIKYNNGHTYGDQTHILLHQKCSSANSIMENYDNIPKKSFKNQLPKPTGGNKLTESMVSGYTGYIPSRKFNFSETYRVECDNCVDNLVTNRGEKFKKESNILDQVKSTPKHTLITTGSELKRGLDNFKDSRQKFNLLKNDKRDTTEPPIPGYTGFVPRIAATDLGLGATYHETTKKGLIDFKDNYVFNQSQKFDRSTVDRSQSARVPSNNTNSKRIYVPPGMIPKYTGYVHGRKFQFGNTYGNTTRTLPVCTHSSMNFGEYMVDHVPKTAIC